MTGHGALTIILDIKDGMKMQVDETLKQIDADANNNPQIPFSKMGSIHFARFVLIETRPGSIGKPIPHRLAFTSNFDLPTENHLHELIQYGGPCFWKLFSMCEGFLQGDYNADALKKFILSRNKVPETFYVGVGNRSVKQIRLENELRNSIQSFLDINQGSLAGKDDLFIRKEIINYVFSKPELSWAKNPEVQPSWAYKFNRSFKLYAVLFLFIVLLPVIIPFAIIWLLIILGIEISEKDEKCGFNKDHARRLLDRETGVVQNQFSAYGSVKPGWFRYQTMMFLLRLTNFLAPYLFSKGRLSGIPTVHFARWLVISEGRQMFFLSNYDGNSEGYLRDFIHIAGHQLTLLFTHTIGYPKTRLMWFGGADDAQCFMQWARQNQIITNVWYSANPTLTVKNIFQNSEIRNGLYGTMNSQQAREWLQKF